MVTKHCWKWLSFLFGFVGAVGFYSLTVIALNFNYISHVCFNLSSDTVCIFIIDGEIM